MKTVIRKPAHHGLHIIMSILTLGMWLPVWAVAAAVGRREVIRVPDSPAQLYPSGIAPGAVMASDMYAPGDGSLWRWNPYANRWDRAR